MGKIIVLPGNIIDMLRAGEVVERPASALKELIENSVDAGARNIRMEISQGGKRLISVSDDGSGMSPGDALLALQKHSTSKISSAEDLFAIGTLGFRGEALPSIASVSRLTLRTALRGQKEGVQLEAEAGRIVSERPSAFRGTLVTVRDLFFNTPARRKFMKSDSTETTHAIGAVTKEALARFNVGFWLSADDEEAMSLSPAGSLRERIGQIYGPEFLDGLREVRASRNGLSLSGFVSKDGNLRGTRSHQYLFVNGRPVRDPAVSHAVSGSVHGEAGRHPIFFLFIEADPSWVDVNVHPRKEEVHFRDRDALYRFVHGSVKEAVPERAPLERGGAAEYEPALPGPATSSAADFAPPAGRHFFAAECLPLEYQKEEKNLFLRLGEMFCACPVPGGGLMLVDQHAAHERVLFEKFMKGAGGSRRPLLFARHIKLPPAERSVLLSNRGLLEDIGIELEDFGGGGVILRCVPGELLEADHASVLSDIAGGLLEGKGALLNMKREVAARLACHLSVRGSQVLCDEELQSLMDALEGCEDPDHCPHGRPTRVLIGLEEMKRMFRRT
jgi:DNA mismatch repair protein MutL